MKKMKRVRSGIELNLFDKWGLAKNEVIYVDFFAGVTLISDKIVSRGDIVDIMYDTERKIMVLRPVSDEGVQAVDSWLVPVANGYDCDSFETVVAEADGQSIIIVPTDTVVTHSDGEVTYLGEEELVRVPANLAAGWRLLRGK